MLEKVLSQLSPSNPWKHNIHYYDCITSTNDVLKQMAKDGAPHGTVLFADRQTLGHGRLGRSFLSPSGVGIYMSILLRPECRPEELMHLTCAVASAMCDAIERSASFRPGIKWTNDLVYKKRKLCGILTELGFLPSGMVDYAVIGIGINCCQKPDDFAPEIRDIAGSLAMVQHSPIDRTLVAASMIDAIENMSRNLLGNKEAILQQYRRDCITLGQDVSIHKADSVRYGRALDIDSNGALIVQYISGETEAVSSGEVSIRGMYGYV